MKSFYDVLRLLPTASDKQIQSAYRILSSEVHPDVNPAPDASERFKEVHRAYEVLGDPARRRAYDRTLEDPPSTRRAPPASPPTTNRAPRPATSPSPNRPPNYAQAARPTAAPGAQPPAKPVVGARYRLEGPASLWGGEDTPVTRGRPLSLQAGVELTVTSVFSELFVRVKTSTGVSGFVHPLQLGKLIWAPSPPSKPEPKRPESRVWRLCYGSAAIFQGVSPTSAVLERVQSAEGLLVGDLVRSGPHVFYSVTTASGKKGYIGAFNLLLVDES